jgi:alkyl hydroperoxide reductase subunit AhpC
VGVSTDPRPSIVAWAQSLGGISYPLLSDFYPHGAVARQYGVFDDERGMAQRAIVIIDRDGVVRYVDVHAIGEQPDEEQIFEQLAALRSA